LSSLPELAKDMTIGGPASGMFTVDVAGTGTGLVVNAGVKAMVKDLTLTGASNSGILNSGDLTLVKVTLTGNMGFGSGGGIRNAGVLKVTNSTIEHNSTTPLGGGGISNLPGADAQVTSSVIRENTAANSGGGIINGGVLRLSSSEVVNNTATVGQGGGIYVCNPGLCAGLAAPRPVVTIANSRIEGNQATSGRGGGLANTGGDVSIDDSEIVGNSGLSGGGLFNDLLRGAAPASGTLTVTNSTISGNASAGSPPTQGIGGGLLNFDTASLTNVVLDGNSAANGGGGIFTCGTTCAGVGDLTLASVTVSGNSAVNSGGGLSVSSGDVAVSNSSFTGNSAGSPGGGIFNIGSLAIDSTHVDSNTAGTGAGIFNAFFSGRGGTLEMTGGTLANNQTTGFGGGLNNGATAAISGTTISGNTASGAGGIFNVSDLKLQGVTISGNSATQNGAGLNNENGVVTVAASAITGNQAGGSGGGIFNHGSLDIDSTTIDGNTALNGVGGGVSNNFYNGFGGMVQISGGVIANNLASSGGGGLFNAATATLEGTFVTGNVASGGGGVNNCGSPCQGVAVLTLEAVTISGNSATQHGGGLNNETGQATIIASAITGNQAGGSGGGIFNHGSLDIDSTTIDGNTALNGGGGGISNNFYNGFGGTLQVTDSTLSNNSTSSANPNRAPGGGLFNTGNADLRNVTISGNTTAPDRSGGGIFNCAANCGSSEGGLDLLNVTIAFNSAVFGGGVSNSASAFASLTNVLLAGNGGGNCAGALASGSHNLSDDFSCAGSFTDSGDQNGAAANLGVLAELGGPTMTHALLPGSAAIDAGYDPGCPDADQRGVDRPQDGDGNASAICDIGAFEVEVDLVG
jgi:hypothetical protein